MAEQESQPGNEASNEPGDGASNEPGDEQVHSVPLDQGADSGTIAQENVGRENMEGSGEWPSPQSPPTGPAPGTAGEVPDRSGPADPFPDEATGSQPESLQDGRDAAGSPGPARSVDLEGDELQPPERFKDVLDADPVLGGSSSVGDPSATTVSREGEPGS